MVLFQAQLIKTLELLLQQRPAGEVISALEETGLRVILTRQFHTYSDPGRDPRQHTASTVFIATATGTPQGADDAARAEIFTQETLPPLAFDHSRILADYFQMKKKSREQN